MSDEVTWYRPTTYGDGVEEFAGTPSPSGKTLTRQAPRGVVRRARRQDGWVDTKEEALEALLAVVQRDLQSARRRLQLLQGREGNVRGRLKKIRARVVDG